jgi:hypothetical protein
MKLWVGFVRDLIYSFVLKLELLTYVRVYNFSRL